MGDKLSISISIYLASLLVASLIGFILYKLCIDIKLRSGDMAEFPSKEMLFGAIPHSLSYFSQIAISNFPILYFGYMALHEEAGIFKISAQLSLIAAFVLRSFDSALQPRISNLYTSEKFKELANDTHRSSIATFLLSAPPYLFMLFFGDMVIEVVFGSDYRSAYPVAIVLLSSVMLRVAFGPVLQILNMTGNAKITMKYGLFSVLALVLSLLVFLPSSSWSVSIIVISVNFLYYLSCYISCKRLLPWASPGIFSSLGKLRINLFRR